MAFDLEPFKAQIEAVAETQHGRVVGSIGRMTAFQVYSGNPFVEFKERAALGLDSEPSDLDILGLRPDELEAIRAIDPTVKVDDAFNSRELRIRARRHGDWMISSNDLQVVEFMPKEFMPRVTTKVLGVEIPSIPLTTHRAIHRMRPLDQKDRVADSRMIETLGDSQSEMSGNMRRLSASIQDGLTSHRAIQERKKSGYKPLVGSSHPHRHRDS